MELAAGPKPWSRRCGAVSEYQYYEFAAVDRPLGQGQMDRLRALSPQATITPAGLVSTYHRGDFRGEPRKLMEQYFDGFLHLTNWGARRVMLRLPARLLAIEVANRYCAGDSARAWTTANHVILDLSSEDEEGGWQSGEGLLARILQVRAELASGDLRALYLAWLACVQADEVGPNEPEPPVPPGLGQLSASQRGLADFLRINPDLCAAAASPPPDSAAPSDAQLARWVAGLPAADKDAMLLGLLRGDDPHLRAEVLRRVRDQSPAGNGVNVRRTAGQLLVAAQARQVERRREAVQRQVAEQSRREWAAAAPREAYPTKLTGRQPRHGGR
jgi:CTP:molybdopterin cytidylyltransferase MocA